jgi:CubicO group peptidase (beta-lactamase class C family)
VRLRLFSLAIVLLLVTLACGENHPLKDLDKSIEDALTDWDVAGMAVAIVKDGRVVHLKGYGYRNIDDKTPMDEHTILGIGSTSKAFGAAAIGVLVDQGKLGWDDKVTDHLPDFRLADPFVTRELTVRDLLCHRSGVATNNAIFFGSVTRDDIVHKARFLEQVASLRSRFDYHNIMILTAGQVAARVSGTSWDEVVRERIFQPLGMDRSCTSINDFDKYTNVATPHSWKDGKLVTIPWLNVDNTGPAGSVNSCAADLARWVQAHLDRGKHEGKVVWSADVQREMHSPHTIMPGSITGRPARHTHFTLYGLGWMMRDYRGRKIVHHGGATDGMGSIIAMVPEEKLGVVILQNTSQYPLLTVLANRIIDAYLGVPASEWTGLEAMRPRVRPGRDGAQPPDGADPSLPLESYVGVYYHPVFEHVEVELEQGGLVLSFDLYPKATLEHSDQDRFILRFERTISSMWDRVFGNELGLEFHVDTDGNVSKLNMRVFGEFYPVDEKASDD